MAKDEGFLSFLRGSVTESAASTYTETEIDTNLSAERGVMMEIHSIDFDFSLLQLKEVAANGEEGLAMQVIRETKTDILNVNDADLIGKIEKNLFRAAAIGTDAGPLWYEDNRPYTIHFPRPIPYVKPSIFIGIKGTTAGSANTGRVRLGFTLRKVSRNEFLELLIALN